MPSERRLHPLSILFGIAAQVRRFLVPGLLFLFLGSRSGGWWGKEAGEWQLWAMLLIIPASVFVVGRYLSLRYRYEPTEMVIRTGLFFRNERHVPYGRIQNLDAVQNVFHRFFGVVEVRVETGGGKEPEATLSVLPYADYEEMRRRVFAGKAGEAPADAEAAAPAPAARTLLSLGVRDLLLLGFIENRGVVLITTGFGLAWELGLADTLAGRIFGEGASGRAVLRDLIRAPFGLADFPVGRLALTFAAFLGLLLAIRLISMAWALTRLYGFRIVRDGEDLRSEYGLLTRVNATIPLPRIQTLTILEGPLHRLSGRASVRVETAGGAVGEGEEDAKRKEREWLAPILRRDELPAFLARVLPDVDLTAVPWEPLHPRAFRRELKSSLLVALLATVPFVPFLGPGALVPLALFSLGAYVHARLYTAHTRWGVTGGAVLFRTGWLWRRVAVARFAKIQSVAMLESPLDRRAGMARVRVDTAGRLDSHRVDIPYLARRTAADLSALLAARADQTAFRW